MTNKYKGIKNCSRRLFLFFAFLLFSACAYATSGVIDFNSIAGKTIIPGSSVGLFEDTSNVLSIDNVVQSATFTPAKNNTINLGISNSTFWLQFSVRNNTNTNALVLALEQPMIDEAEVFIQNSNGTFDRVLISKNTSFFNRLYPYVDYIFNLNIAQHESKTVYVKVKSAAQMVVPMEVSTVENAVSMSERKELLFGLYAGIILVMALYNLFVYFTVKDKSYILYVIYILMIGLTQTTLPGFTFKYLWPNSLWFAAQSINLFSCLVGIAALEFIKEFLKTKEFFPRLNRCFYLFNGLFIVSIILSLAGNRSGSFKLMQADTGLASLFALFISYKIYKTNYRPAKFFLLSWSILLFGAIIFVLKDYGILPYNTITTYTIQMSSVAEIVLLSFALGDKINIFRREKEESQAQALIALQENERIIREQNVILEVKVQERTSELKVANADLNQAMIELKDAETQLVESEKMASLGQLTAGIAHEINNPINFVTSNIKPLNRDVQMLLDTVEELERISLSSDTHTEKQQQIKDFKNEIDFDYLKIEIEQLLSGIGEGASRTAEIVKGLRIFSRLDEDDLKRADINDGLESTLVITNNLLNNIIKVQKNYGNLPLVECYPGKLNQVFLNIISNAIYAIKKKFGDKEGGMLTIETSHDEQNVFIKLKDNGTGMDENTKKRLFEPFFTTKDVGEGTGLGMSIAYNTIVKHNGQIIINSELGAGTEFILELPLIQK